MFTSQRPILKTILNEPEAIVRVEAVHALTATFVHLGISEDEADLLFSTLAHVATNDLDWEVKVAALQFWSTVLNQNFFAQGYGSDGFPKTIFSKQLRKIVHVSSQEVHKRLDNILHDYAYYGGLGVLLACLYDEFHVGVSEKAVEIIKQLKSRLDRYCYNVVPTPQEQTSFHSYNNNIPVLLNRLIYGQAHTSGGIGESMNELFINENGNIDYSAAHNENVLDGIEKEHDYNLVIAAIEQLQLNQEFQRRENHVDVKLYEKFSKINVKLFLQIIASVDLNGIICTRWKWQENNDSLNEVLSDIIFAFSQENDRVFDCY